MSIKINMKPDGFYGWWLLFFLLIAYSLPIGFGLYGPPILYPPMIAETEWARGEIMIGFTLVALLMGIGMPIAIWMIGRFGARVCMFIGGLIMAIAASLIGIFGASYPLYIVLSLGMGLGVALATQLTIQTVVVSWFSARRAMALGVVLGGGGIGGFLAPQLIGAVVRSTGSDWRVGWFVIAIAAAIAALVSILAVRDHPSALGQQPDGLSPAEVKNKVDAPRTSGTYRTTAKWTVRQGTKTSALWLLIIAAAVVYFSWNSVLTQTPLHLQDRGFDPAMAALFYSLAVGCSILGRFAIAGLGDIIEPRKLVICAIICMFLGSVLFWFVSPDAIWIAYLYPLLVGLGFGATLVCVPTIVGNYWGVDAFAGINGLALMIPTTISALAPPMAGFIYDSQSSYFIMMVICWVGAAIGLAAILICRPPLRKEMLN